MGDIAIVAVSVIVWICVGQEVRDKLASKEHNAESRGWNPLWFLGL